MKLDRQNRDLACSVQIVIEEIVLRMLRYHRRTSGQARLCINNTKMLCCLNQKTVFAGSGFTEVHVQNIESSATGAALFAWHQHVANDSFQSNKVEHYAK